MTRRFFFIFALSFLFQSAYAFNEYDGSWFLTFGGGRSYYRVNGDSYINVCPSCPPDHYYKNDIHDAAFLNLIGGYALARNSTYLPLIMMGVNLTYTVNGKISGNINQFDLVQFKNYVYSYDFSRQSAMGILKVDLFSIRGFMPFVMAGAGGSYNRASSYQEEPLANVTPRVSPGYGTKTTANAAYLLGAGLDYYIYGYLLASLSYQFGDFGYVKTSNGRDNESITGLNYSQQHLKNKLRANSVALDFTYLIDYT